MSNVLIVDDESLIRTSLSDFLDEEFNVRTADSGPQALEILKDWPTDLIISDINMKPMDGIEFLVEAKKLYPQIKTALITGYDVDDYIRLIKKHRITNVITKATPFDFEEFVNTVHNILDPSRVFGLASHLSKNATIHTVKPRTHDEKDALTEEMVNTLHPMINVPRRAFEIRLVFEEMVNNAFFHAYTNDNGEPLHGKENPTDLLEGEEIIIEWGFDDDAIGFTVTDSAGTLSIDRFLEKIERQVTQEGIMDEDGRGFFLARAFASRLIINVEPRKRTQMIIIFSRHHKPSQRPLHINLID